MHQQHQQHQQYMHRQHRSPYRGKGRQTAAQCPGQHDRPVLHHAAAGGDNAGTELPQRAQTEPEQHLVLGVFGIPGVCSGHHLVIVVIVVIVVVHVLVLVYGVAMLVHVLVFVSAVQVLEQ